MSFYMLLRDHRQRKSVVSGIEVVPCHGEHRAQPLRLGSPIRNQQCHGMPQIVKALRRD